MVTTHRRKITQMVNINIGYRRLGQENNARQLDQPDKYNGGQYKTICYK